MQCLSRESTRPAHNLLTDLSPQTKSNVGVRLLFLVRSSLRTRPLSLFRLATVDRWQQIFSFQVASRNSRRPAKTAILIHSTQNGLGGWAAFFVFCSQRLYVLLQRRPPWKCTMRPLASSKQACIRYLNSTKKKIKDGDLIKSWLDQHSVHFGAWIWLCSKM